MKADMSHTGPKAHFSGMQTETMFAMMAPITAHERLVDSEKALEEALKFESMLAEISTRFVNLPVDQIEDKIIETLCRVCEFFGADRTTLWLASEEEPESFRLSYVHQLPECKSPPERMDGKSFYPWTVRKLLNGEILAISKMADLPPEAERDRETWRSYGTKSTLVIPLPAGGGRVLGVVSFALVREEKDWPELIVKRLHLIAELFANLLARKHSDASMRETEEHLRLAADAAGAGLWIIDLEKERVWATAMTRKLFLLSPDEELSSQSFLRAVHPDDHETVKQSVQQALQSGEGLNTEHRIMLPDGRIRWILSRGRGYVRSNGEPDRVMGVSVDVTEHRAMEEQLCQRLREIEELKKRLEGENLYLQNEVGLQHEHSEIVGRSLAMKKVLTQAEQVAQTDSTVLILGETGTGKELLARAIHTMSSRKNRLLVSVNCASLPPTLIESELFGRERGAYTGALTKMFGRFEVADGATLFLDEIGELPAELQSKLLRVLEEGKFERLGSTKTLHVDVRIIAATNRDIARETAEGRFRKDLFYRLNVFPIVIPPLREHPEDIPLIVWTFVREFQRKMGKSIESIPKDAMDALRSYSWPGNVRELRNVVEHAMIVSKGKTLAIQAPDNCTSPGSPDDRRLADVERTHIIKVLEQNRWRIGGRYGAAEDLGMKRSTLYSKMKKLGIDHRVPMPR